MAEARGEADRRAAKEALDPLVEEEAVGVRLGRARAALQQQLDHLQVVLDDGEVERRLAVVDRPLVPGVDHLLDVVAAQLCLRVHWLVERLAARRQLQQLIDRLPVHARRVGLAGARVGALVQQEEQVQRRLAERAAPVQQHVAHRRRLGRARDRVVGEDVLVVVRPNRIAVRSVEHGLVEVEGLRVAKVPGEQDQLPLVAGVRVTPRRRRLGQLDQLVHERPHDAHGRLAAARRPHRRRRRAFGRLLRPGELDARVVARGLAALLVEDEVVLVEPSATRLLEVERVRALESVEVGQLPPGSLQPLAMVELVLLAAGTIVSVAATPFLSRQPFHGRPRQQVGNL